MVRQALGAQQRCAGKSYKIGIRKSSTHVLSQVFVLRAVCLIHQHEDVISGCQDGVFLGLIVTELVNQSEDKLLVLGQVSTQLLAVLGVAFILVADNFRAQEVLVNLGVQVFAVGDNQESEVTFHFALHLAGKHHHGIGLTAALGVPEHTQLALQLLAAGHGIHQVIYAQVLVILGYDLILLALKEYEILDIVNQSLFPQQTVNKSGDGKSVFPDFAALRLFLFTIYLQPLKEEVIAGVECPKLGFQPV